MTTGQWKFEDGQWQGPLWPIKTLAYGCLALIVGIVLIYAATMAAASAEIILSWM